MKKADWKDLDEFNRRYFDKMTKICILSIDNQHEEVRDRAFALWCDVRPWVNRKPTHLCFDCVYIMGNAMGNKNTVPFLTYISEQLFQTKIKPMHTKQREGRPHQSGRWFITDRGRASILTALAGSFSDIKPHHHELYEDAVGLWMLEEEE